MKHKPSIRGFVLLVRTQLNIFHDQQDPAFQSMIRSWAGNRQLENYLNSSGPFYKPFQDYMNAQIRMREKLEQAGFNITFGPTTKLGCVNRLAESGGVTARPRTISWEFPSAAMEKESGSLFI